MRIVRPLLLTLLLLALAAAAGAEHHEEASADEAVSPSDSIPGTPTGEVTRAAFSTAIEEREPIDDIVTLSSGHEEVLFFTELTGLEGSTVTHRWERDGEVMAEVPFEVRGQRWRVWSTKKLNPEWTGDWSVSVIDDAGRVIESRHFSFFAPSDSAEPVLADGPATEQPAEQAPASLRE